MVFQYEKRNTIYGISNLRVGGAGVKSHTVFYDTVTQHGHRIANTYEGSTPTTHTQPRLTIYPVVELRDA